MTIIYVDDDARVAEPTNKSQQNDLKGYFPGLKPGDRITSPLNPEPGTSERPTATLQHDTVDLKTSKKREDNSDK